MNAQLLGEIQRVSNLYEKHWYQDWNFTVCVLKLGARIESIGVAKRNPNCDPDVPERGKAISLARAVKKLQATPRAVNWRNV